MTRIKQVILVRKDLTMRRGKEIAQGSHAAMEFLVGRLREQLVKGTDGALAVTLTETEKSWLLAGTGKVCLKVESEAQLIDCHERAQAAGLKSFLITDAGRTEFHGVPTRTACAIGPDTAERIDQITGTLIPY